MEGTLAATLRHASVEGLVNPEDSAAAATATAGFDTSIRFAPEAIVAATSPRDVEATIAVARRDDIPVTVLGTGHGMLADVDGGILISTHALAGVTVDADRRTARVTAGADWNRVLDATTAHGLAALCGSAPSVGVVSYLLGGGIGPLARTFGFSADHVRSFEVVTPAHGLITVTAEDQPELFWALRGGKSGLGIVTATTIDLLALTQVYGGGLYFSADAASDVVHAVVEWAPRLPESATASIALLRLPAVPALPEPLRGRFVAHVRFASVEDPAAAEELLTPIRRLATPLIDTIGVLPYSKLGTIHADPTQPMPVTSGGKGLRPVDAATVEALWQVAGPELDIPVSAIELRCLGGALGREPTVANAVGGRDTAWNLFASALPTAPADTARAHVRTVLGALEPWQAQANLVNFVGRANAAEDARRCWTNAQLDRLDAIRAAADPNAILAPPRAR